MAVTWGKRELEEPSPDEIHNSLEENARKAPRVDSDKYIRELEAKLKKLKEENSNLKSLQNPVDKIEASGPNDNVPTYLERFGKLITLTTGEDIYVGPSSMNLFGSELKKLVDATEEPLQMVANPYGIKCKEPNLCVEFNFPSYSYCILLVETFVSYNDGCYYFFNEGLVKENLKRIFNEKEFVFDYGSSLNAGSDNYKFLETVWYCKLLLIFAVGEMYLSTSTDNNLLPGSSYFCQAQRLFQGLYGGGVENFTNVGSIEVLLLYGFYHQMADMNIQAYYYINAALDTCVLLGDHVDIGKGTVNRFELEHRRRLFWTVYMYERMIATKQGLPLSVADDDIITELPEDFDMTTTPPNCENYIFPEAEFISNCVKITQINSEILKNLYTKDSRNVLSSIQQLVIKLFKWKKTLPKDLFCDFSQRELNTSRLVVNMMTEYLQGFNLAVRPLLFNLVIHNVKIGNLKAGKYLDLSSYSNIIVALLKSSFQASINTIRSFWSLLPDNMVATFGFMDREYIFNSTVTCILYNATFGIQDQSLDHLDHSLRMFLRMKRMGNKSASINLDQILSLLKLVDVNESMSSLIEKHSGSPSEEEVGSPVEPPEPILEEIDLESVHVSASDLDLWNKITQSSTWSGDLAGVESLLNSYL